MVVVFDLIVKRQLCKLQFVPPSSI